MLRLTRSRLAVRIDTIAPPGAVLDVGSGDGTLVRALKRQGRSARGLERGDPPLSELPGPWAAIVFWHSLEHLPAPVTGLRQAAAQLAPGGVLIVAIPNAESLQAHAFSDRWLALDLPRHLTHASAPALRTALEALDLHVERESYWRGGQVGFGWLHGFVGILPGRPNLYSAVRRPQARPASMTALARTYALVAACGLAPFAMAASGVEVLLHRGGSVYMEARRQSSAMTVPRAASLGSIAAGEGL